MKTISKLCAVGILTIFLFATIKPVIGLNSQIKDNNMVFEFYFSKPQINEIKLGNSVIDRVTIEDLSNTNNFNEPRLPIKSTKILLKPGGNFVCKVFDGEYLQDFIQKTNKMFKTVKQLSPNASRKSSSEIYIIARFRQTS